MNMIPLVSVVIPVYNVEKYLGRCLDSVLAQDYNNIELICVDDCSTDNSLSILRKYESQYANIRVLSSNENGGLGAARDLGLANVSGSYVLFIDSDDYISSDYVSTYLNALESDTDIVVGGYCKCIGERKIECRTRDTHGYAWLNPSACVRLYKVAFLKERAIDFRGIRYYEDGVFNIRCMLEHPKCRVIDYCGYFYVINQNSITQKRNGDQLFRMYVANYEQLARDIRWENLNRSDYGYVEYAYVQGLTICMLYNLRHCGVNKVKEFKELRRNCLIDVFPDYLTDSMKCSKDDSIKNRLALQLYIFLERIHLAQIMMWLIAR